MDVTEQLVQLNYAVALDRLGGDEELLQEVARLFLDEYPSMLSAIEKAVLANDPIQVERSAHSLKGSVSNFGADGAYEAALQLERMGRVGNLAGAREAYVTLAEIMTRLRPRLMSVASI